MVKDRKKSYTKQELHNLMLDPLVDKKSNRVEMFQTVFGTIYVMWIALLFLIFFEYEYIDAIIFVVISISILIIEDRWIDDKGVKVPENKDKYKNLIRDFVKYFEDPKQGKTTKIADIVDKISDSKRKIYTSKPVRILNAISLSILFGCFLVLWTFAFILDIFLLADFKNGIYVDLSNAYNRIPFVTVAIIVIFLGSFILGAIRATKQDFLNVFAGKTLFIGLFDKVIDDIEGYLKIHIKIKEIPTEEERNKLLHYLDEWYDLYRGIYFKKQESNQMFLENFDFYFSYEKLKSYWEVFSKLKTSLSRAKRKSIIIKDPQSEEIENLILYVSIFIEELTFKINLENMNREENKARMAKFEQYINILMIPLTFLATILSILAFFT